MAPEFNFFVSTEDNALVENVKARASANRQALGNRQELKKAENVVRNQATKNDNPTRSGAIRPRKASAEEELIAHRKGGFKVLNLVLGNGPVRNERLSLVTEWRATISGVPNSVWDSPIDVDFISDGTAVPAVTDGLTYSDYINRMEDLEEYVQRESQNVYGNRIDNVWVQLTGGTQYNPSAVRVEGDYEPGVFDFREYVFDREPSTTINIPAVVGNGWTYVEMPVNTLNITSYLLSRGVNLNAYNLIFVDLNYRITGPIFNGGPGQGGTTRIPYRVYASQPPIYYTSVRSSGSDSGLIINEDLSIDPDSYPIHNLLKDLDASNTTFIDFSTTSAENITLGTSLSSSSQNQTELQLALNNAYNKRAKIVTFVYSASSGRIQILDGVYRGGTVPGTDSLITRVKLNRKYNDWSLRSTIEFEYTSYLRNAFEDTLDLTGLPVGFENSSNYDTTYGPYYSSVINRRTV